jgi:peptide/nickel transport system substrate-binding protein
MDVDKIEVADDYTVILRTKEPDSSFLSHLTHWGGGCILNEKATEAAGEDFGSRPVGTGPYAFVEWQKGDHVTLKRFDGYWGAKPAIENVIVRTITEGTNRTIELEAKGVDIAYSILPIDISKVADNPALVLLRCPDTIVNYLGFNLTHKPFDDIRVRQAIAHAINTPAIIRVVFRGVGNAATGPVSPGVRYYSKDLKAIPYDMDKAKLLLKEAGLEKGFKTSILTAERKERVDIATIVQSELKKLGIEVEVNVLEWGAFQEKLKDRTHDMYLNSWTTAVPDPDYSVFGPFHSSQAKTGLNRSMVAVPGVDKLIEDGRRAPDGPEREKIYQELQWKLYDLLPWVFLQNGEQLVGAQKNVKGFTPDPGGYHVLYRTYFEE